MGSDEVSIRQCRNGPAGREGLRGLVESRQDGVIHALVVVAVAGAHVAGLNAQIDRSVNADARTGSIVDSHVDGRSVGLRRRLNFESVTAVQEETEEQSIRRVRGGAAGDGIVGAPIERIRYVRPSSVV